MSQKQHHIIIDAGEWFPLNPNNMLKYKSDYRDLASQTCFTMGFYTGALAASKINIKEKNISENAGHASPEVNDMLSLLKDKMLDFCKNNKNIHSSWYKIDQPKREVVIYTVLDQLDFDLEYKIFQELYIDLPVIVEEYYINPMVMVLNGDKVKTKIPANSTQLYSRIK